MQCRYIFEPQLCHSRARLAQQLAPALAEKVSLQLEASGPAPTGVNPEIYALMSQVLLQPTVQLYHGQLSHFKAHPLQWNIVMEPDTQTVPATVDEIWSQDPELLSAFETHPAVKTLLAEGLNSPEVSEDAQLPIEMEEPHIVLASLDWEEQEKLKRLLTLYMQSLGTERDYGLALHIDADPALEGIEEELLEIILAVAEGCQLDAEGLNLGSWIGELEMEPYYAMLKKSAALMAPRDFQSAREALSFNVPVIDLDLSPEAFKSRLHSPGESLPGLETLLASICQRLEQIEQEFDPEPRARAYQQALSERQGRKQKYSLFHSDYGSQEMQARRNWHSKYAKMFEQVPGPVLDIGSGSGIFLEILRDWGWPAMGLDPDPDMVAVCQELGLQAILGDERQLEAFQPLSLGGIHASHVIEHVDGERAIAMVENARRVLRPGGVMVVRTPNWQNATVRHEGFWLDVTHIRPYPLPLLKQIFEDAGFEIEAQGYEDFGWNDTFILARQPEVKNA